MSLLWPASPHFWWASSYVPEDDEHWCNYLLLLDIVDITFCQKNHGGHPRLPAPADRKASFQLLSPLPRILHYPQDALIFMIHIPRLMLRYILFYFLVASWVYSLCPLTYTCRLGPLVCHWTIWFEAKNKYFKSLAHSTWKLCQSPLLPCHAPPAAAVLLKFEYGGPWL